MYWDFWKTEALEDNYIMGSYIGSGKVTLGNHSSLGNDIWNHFKIYLQ